VIAYIVTEGQFDGALLTRLLAEEVRSGVHITSGSGKSGAQSLARSLVAARRRPVALVLDADTTEEALIREERLVARELLAMASPGIPTEVIMAVPSMEVLFFKDRNLLGRLTADNLPDEQWVQARFQPRRVLEQFLRTARASVHGLPDLLRGLEDADVALMREHPPVSEILGFLRETAFTGAAEAPS
jgi:hypothetical protein